MADTLGIIIAYNHEDALQECLQSAIDSDHPVDWVVWVNGGISRDFKVPPGVTMHFSDENILWTPALNRAIEKYLGLDHKYIFYCNHDVKFPAHTISQLKATLDQIPDAGAVAPCGYGIGGTQDWTANQHLYSKTDLPVRTYVLIGSIVMMKAEVLAEIGMFDENMPLGLDDFDYSIRMLEAEYSLWVLSNVVVKHRSHITGSSPNWDKYGPLGAQYFDKKYDGYFKPEEAEAFWNFWYNEKYPFGTGISHEEKIRRGIVHI